MLLWVLSRNQSFFFLSIYYLISSLKIFNSLTRRDYFNKGREKYHYLPWYGNYHGKSSGSYYRSQKIHEGSRRMECSFLPTLIGGTAVKGTTCLRDSPTPAVTRGWNSLDAFPGQLQHQMAQQSDYGTDSSSSRSASSLIRWEVKHLQHPQVLFSGQQLPQAPEGTAPQLWGFQEHSWMSNMGVSP